jgi:hypothetical protein
VTNWERKREVQRIGRPRSRWESDSDSDGRRDWIQRGYLAGYAAKNQVDG